MTDKEKLKLAEELGDVLCSIHYCPIMKEFRSSGYSTPNGYVSCEGSHCPEALEAYLEEMEEENVNTKY